MIDVVTMSSKGQFVIPKGIRDEMRIREKDKFLMINTDEGLLLKRLREDDSRPQLKRLLQKFRSQVKHAGISQKDIDSELKAVRNEKSRA